jgi:Glycosyltransferase 61
LLAISRLVGVFINRRNPMKRVTTRILKISILLAVLYFLYFGGQTKRPDDQLNQKELFFKGDIPTVLSEPVTLTPKLIVPKTTFNTSWKFIQGQKGDRDAMIEAKDFCIVDGVLVYPSNNIQQPPAINLGGSADVMDVWVQFQHRKISFEEVIYVKRPLFVMGGVWSYHMSHFFVNNMLPLLNVMNHYYKSTKWMDEERDLHIANNINMFDINPFNFTNSWTNQNRPSGAICYETAIIGLNSTCDCCGCKKDLPNKVVYGQLKDIILKAHLSPDEYLESKGPKKSFHLVIVDRLSSRRILNLEQIEIYLKNRKTSYQVVHLENLSFEQQVKLFALNATMLLASHGNAIGSALWMRERSVLVESHSYKQRSGSF